MFRITEDPSSGNHVQYLAKITITWLVLWQQIVTLINSLTPN